MQPSDRFDLGQARQWASTVARSWRERLRAVDAWISRKLFELLWFEEK